MPSASSADRPGATAGARHEPFPSDRASGTSTSSAAGPIGAEALTRARAVRLVAFDVDGTLTDGSILIGPDGEAMKRFSVRDGFGLSLLRRSGLKLAIITARQSAIVALRAGELRFDHVLQGVADKRQALAGLCERERLQPHETAFMGDDWPDLGALGYAGLAAAVSDAAAEVQARAHWVGTVPAGRGAVREFAEWLLRAQGRWETLLGEFSR